MFTTKHRKLRNTIKRGELCCMRARACVLCSFTFIKSSIGLLLQRLEAAAVLIDGLHLCIFVPRRRLVEKNWFLHFPRIPATPIAAYRPSPLNDADGGAAQAPLCRFSPLTRFSSTCRGRIDSIGKVSRAARRLFES